MEGARNLWKGSPMRKLVIAAVFVSMLAVGGCAMMKNCPVHRALFGSGEEDTPTEETATDKPRADATQ